MLSKLAKCLMLATALSGLCSAAQANTTVTTVDVTDEPQAAPAVAAPENAPVVAPVATPTIAAEQAHKIRIGVILPLRSATLGAAAAAVRAGVQAGYEREKDGMVVHVIETDGSAPDTLTAYIDTAEHYDVIIGPLSRSEVGAIVQSGKVSKPTIALAPMELVNDQQNALPPNMLAMGLSIEEEARQAANWISGDSDNTKAVVVSTNVAWQRRTAKAFAGQWHALGLASQSLELGIADGYLSANSLVQLRKLVETQNPALLFVALDAGQTAQLRLAIGTGMPIYGISQLNPLALPDGLSFERLRELDGARLVDIPWQLQPDHPAVMSYPRMTVAPDQPRSPDMARLYALGIDAYRVAREIALHRTDFMLDGVTGKLAVNVGRGPARFERVEQEAVYKDGMPVPLADVP